VIGEETETFEFQKLF